jgi:hypothetical protein
MEKHRITKAFGAIPEAERRELLDYLQTHAKP